MSGTKEEAIGYVFMDLSSPRMLPCSLDTSFKKDIDGLQYDIRGRAGGKKSTVPPPSAPLPPRAQPTDMLLKQRRPIKGYRAGLGGGRWKLGLSYKTEKAV